MLLPTTGEPMVGVVVNGLPDWDYIAAPEALVHKVRLAIHRFDLLRSGDRCVVGVSGGPDSVALLHVLWRLQKEQKWHLVVAHLNHCLRGADADDDEAFVIALCQRWEIPCVTRRVDVRAMAKAEKLSIAQAGRRARYQFFAEVARQHGAQVVALGHTASDVVETVLLNLFRGTGIEGLQGIPPKSPLTLPEPTHQWRETGVVIVRPLLLCWRTETMAYARVYRLQFRQDVSNLDTTRPRNWVREALLPSLRQRFPQVERALWRLSEVAREHSEWVHATAAQQLAAMTLSATPDSITVERNALLALPRAVQRQVLRLMVNRLVGELNEVSFEHIEQALSLIARHAGKAMVSLPHRLTVRVERGTVCVERQPTTPPTAS
ncbi:tRNA(Ile)-lysidine synthase [bacterium HR17]|uniref:tRNA(Ile)-lysidine synthase n=1 Tax=Candidatus Fervidibacter japonicus TaxID=2035412 RepID=A0A2H5XC43_9BACT|nr:tRNA(Ile)-lysidine synthase [bacterium HR17]